MDRLTVAKRSALMSRIRGKGTAPELAVRRLVHGMGFRFRLHRRDLPGSPDLVFPRFRRVIFVHGCFWHAHGNCRRAHAPIARLDYWAPKLARNKARDAAAEAALTKAGWRVLVIWECEIRDLENLTARVAEFLTDVSAHLKSAESSPMQAISTSA